MSNAKVSKALKIALDISNLKKSKMLEENKQSSNQKEDEKDLDDKLEEDNVTQTTFSDRKKTLERNEDKPCYYQNQENINLDTIKIINRNLENELYDKRSEIRMLQKNYKEKMTLVELENKKLLDSIVEKNNIYILQLNEESQKKVKEIEMQYERTTALIQREYISLINEMRLMRSTHISIKEHKEKMSKLDSQWDKKYKESQMEYDSKYKKLYQTVNASLDINHSICNKSLNNTSVIINKSNEEMIINAIDKIKLEHEIGFNSFVIDSLAKYNQANNSFNRDKDDSYNALKSIVIKKFNDIMFIANNDKDFVDKQIKLNYNKSKVIENKRNEIVNYESCESKQPHLSVFQNDDSVIGFKKNNDIINSILTNNNYNKGNFTSEFEVNDY